MSKQCLCIYHLEFSTWSEGQLPFIDAKEKVGIPKPNKVVLYESAFSGQVLLTGGGDPSPAPTTLLITDPEIFVKIRYGEGLTEYLSAPLHTSLEYSNVTSLSLHMIFFIGPPGWKKSQYSSQINAHLIYEISH